MAVQFALRNLSDGEAGYSYRLSRGKVETSFCSLRDSFLDPQIGKNPAN